MKIKGVIEDLKVFLKVRKKKRKKKRMIIKIVKIYLGLSLVLLWAVLWGQFIFRVQLFATPLTVAYQAPLSMGFSRQ